MPSYYSDKLFEFRVTVTLTLDLMTSKINRVHLLVTPSLHVKFVDHGCRQYLVHLLARPYIYVKFEEHRCRHC